MVNIFKLIKINDMKGIEKLIKIGYNLDKQNMYGETALMSACWYGKNEIIFKLIEAGCNLDLQDMNGETTLMDACNNNQKDVVFKLIEFGCNLNIQDKNGKTYKDYINTDMEPIIEKALVAHKIFNKLFGDCIKYIRRNRSKFKEKDIIGLNKDIRCYL